MPVNNVDLSAVLPVLLDAAKPFMTTMARIDSKPPGTKPSPTTPLRALLGGPRPALDDLRKLMDAVEAVKRVSE